MTKERGGFAYAFAMAVTWVPVAVLLFVFTQSDEAVWPDFGSFYSAAYLARTSPGDVFDTAAQAKVQRELVGRPVPLLFYHPPYELIPLIPLTALPYRTAFFLWSALQAAILMCIPALLRPLVRVPRSRLHLALVCFAFAPIWIALAQGQDSVLLLLLLALAGRDLLSGRDVRSGLWIGLALFKLQIALPIAGLLFLAGRRKTLAGFFGGALVAFLLSVWVVGWGQLAAYPEFLATMARKHAHGTVDPEIMLNLRGLLWNMGAKALAPRAELVLVVSASLVVVLIAIIRLRGARWSAPAILGLSISVAAAVSYHFNPHDISILLIPILILLGQIAGRALGRAGVVGLVGVAVIYSPWTYLVLGGNRRLGIAALGLLAVIGAQIALGHTEQHEAGDEASDRG